VDLLPPAIDGPLVFPPPFFFLPAGFRYKTKKTVALAGNWRSLGAHGASTNHAGARMPRIQIADLVPNRATRGAAYGDFQHHFGIPLVSPASSANFGIPLREGPALAACCFFLFFFFFFFLRSAAQTRAIKNRGYTPIPPFIPNKTFHTSFLPPIDDPPPYNHPYFPTPPSPHPFPLPPLIPPTYTPSTFIPAPPPTPQHSIPPPPPNIPLIPQI